MNVEKGQLKVETLEVRWEEALMMSFMGDIRNLQSVTFITNRRLNKKTEMKKTKEKKFSRRKRNGVKVYREIFSKKAI